MVTARGPFAVRTALWADNTFWPRHDDWSQTDRFASVQRHARADTVFYHDDDLVYHQPAVSHDVYAPASGLSYAQFFAEEAIGPAPDFIDDNPAQPESLARQFFRHATWPAIVGTGMLASYYMMQAGYSELVSFPPVVAAAIGAMSVVEHFFPNEISEKIDGYSPREKKVSLLHNLLSVGLIPEFLVKPVFAGLGAVAVAASTSLIGGLDVYQTVADTWLNFGLPNFSVGSIPVAAFLIGGMLIKEPIEWTTHVIGHLLPQAWRFHEVHHWPRKLSAFTASHEHFAETARPFLALATLQFLGFPDEVCRMILMHGILINICAHTNSHIQLPEFIEKYIMVGPKGHRLHHSIETFDTNFANVYPWMDQVNWHKVWCTLVDFIEPPGDAQQWKDAFPLKDKTFYDTDNLEKTGIKWPLPPNYLYQLVVPFLSRRTQQQLIQNKWPDLSQRLPQEEVQMSAFNRGLRFLKSKLGL